MYASARNADSTPSRIQALLDGAGIGRIGMNRDRRYGIWKQLRGRVKERWGALAGDPRTAAAGTRERIAGRIQECCGIAKERADRQLEEFMSRNRSWWDLSRR